MLRLGWRLKGEDGGYGQGPESELGCCCPTCVAPVVAPCCRSLSKLPGSRYARLMNQPGPMNLCGRGEGRERRREIDCREHAKGWS